MEFMPVYSAARLLVSLLFVSNLAGRTLAQSNITDPSNLNGAHFRITVVEEDGFLDIHEHIDDKGNYHLSYSGYLISLINSVARPDRANFTFDLLPPSGFGSPCEPRLDPNQDEQNSAYGKSYRTQYNCGASDTNDVPLMTNYSTDMYLGMFYVTPLRQ